MTLCIKYTLFTELIVKSIESLEIHEVPDWVLDDANFCGFGKLVIDDPFGEWDVCVIDVEKYSAYLRNKKKTDQLKPHIDKYMRNHKLGSIL